MGTIKSKSKIKEQFEIGKKYLMDQFPFNNELAWEISNQYCMNCDDLIRLKNIFENLDQRGVGYLIKEDLY